MRLQDVINGIDVIRQDADASLDIAGITYDSHQVKPGFLFAAIPGFKTDGHDFVPAACGAGAAAILTGRWLEGRGIPQVQTADVRLSLARTAANFYRHPSRALTLIGVTGTNGKTTTTYLIDAIIRTVGKKTGLIGGIEYRTGEASVASSRTTPESVDIEKMLDEMRTGGVEAATLEVSSHGIELFRVAFLDFDIAVFTNLTREHLDLHQDMESYFAVKQRLFNGDLAREGTILPPGRRPQGVINTDDEYGRRLAGGFPEAITFGVDGFNADITARNITRQGWDTTFELSTPGGRIPVTLHLPGDYNLSNALAAAGAGFALGASKEVIAAGLESVYGVPGRFERVGIDSPFQVVIDYAHNEDGLAKSLDTAAGLTSNRLIVVFGCPGERDREKRPRMGRIAGTAADMAILTTDDCYDEPPQQILDETEPGLAASGADYEVITDRRQAIEKALSLARAGDTVLIAGKGHESRQILAEGPVPFSDRKVVEELLGSS